MAQWYYANGEREHGPIDESEFPALVRSGVVTRDTLVWTDRMAEWEPAAAHVDALRHARPAVPASGTSDQAGSPAGRDYRRTSGMKDAFLEFFRRYTDFRGRSNRGEFWWFVLDSLLIGIGLGVIDTALFGEVGADIGVLSNVWGLATLIPSLALNTRRLHDIDRSGWWQLLMLVPIVGWLVLIVWWSRSPDAEPNRFG